MNININDLLKNQNLLSLVTKVGEEIIKGLSVEEPVIDKVKDPVTDADPSTVTYYKNLVGFGLFRCNTTQRKYVISGVSTLLVVSTPPIVNFRDVITGEDFSITIDLFKVRYSRVG